MAVQPPGSSGQSMAGIHAEKRHELCNMQQTRKARRHKSNRGDFVPEAPHAIAMSQDDQVTA